MEISAEEGKRMINNADRINIEIIVCDEKLETFSSFKYLGSVVSNEGSRPEIFS